MKEQLDPIIMDLGKSALCAEPQESYSRSLCHTYLSCKNMGLLVLLVLALFLIPERILVWPIVVSQLLVITASPPPLLKVRKRQK